MQPNAQTFRLSICIATFNRAGFIGQTLDAILAQMSPLVELVVVDGASSDGTAELMAGYVQRHPQVVYCRESENSGVDQDFDKAVGRASGDYCWLMSDDDLIAPGAIAKVLAQLQDDPDVVIVNAQIRDQDLQAVLKPRQLALSQDRRFGAQEHEQFFACAGSYLSFIGAVVVRRAFWLGRARQPYYGSLFVHVGVLFQQPAPRQVKVMAEPLVYIRYGNALWSARGFEIWTTKWPDLVWSFDQFSVGTREAVSSQHPATRLTTLVWYRGIGAYGPADYKRLFAATGRAAHPLAGVVARLPAGLANAALALVCAASRHADARMKLFDLGRAACAPAFTRWLNRP